MKGLVLVGGRGEWDGEMKMVKWDFVRVDLLDNREGGGGFQRSWDRDTWVVVWMGDMDG